jgi:hypothetical protein
VQSLQRQVQNYQRHVQNYQRQVQSIRVVNPKLVHISEHNTAAWANPDGSGTYFDLLNDIRWQFGRDQLRSGTVVALAKITCERDETRPFYALLRNSEKGVGSLPQLGLCTVGPGGSHPCLVCQKRHSLCSSNFDPAFNDPDNTATTPHGTYIDAFWAGVSVRVKQHYSNKVPGSDPVRYERVKFELKIDLRNI